MIENGFKMKDGVYEIAPVIHELNKNSNALSKEFVLCKCLVSNRFAMDKIGHLTMLVKEGEYFFYPRLHANKSEGITVEVIKESKKKIKEIEEAGFQILNHPNPEFARRVQNTNEVEVSKMRIKQKALAE